MTNRHNHNLKRYQYRDCWVEIYLDFEEEGARVLYSASIELPRLGGVIATNTYPTREEAELAAARLIDAAESESQPR